MIVANKLDTACTPAPDCNCLKQFALLLLALPLLVKVFYIQTILAFEPYQNSLSQQ